MFIVEGQRGTPRKWGVQWKLHHDKKKERSSEVTIGVRSGRRPAVAHSQVEGSSGAQPAEERRAQRIPFVGRKKKSTDIDETTRRPNKPRSNSFSLRIMHVLRQSPRIGASLEQKPEPTAMDRRTVHERITVQWSRQRPQDKCCNSSFASIWCNRPQLTMLRPRRYRGGKRTFCDTMRNPPPSPLFLSKESIFRFHFDTLSSGSPNRLELLPIETSLRDLIRFFKRLC
jgi:hypothetical protein